MVLMALDHVRSYFYYGSFFRDPTDLETTTPSLFATRWVTHFCAPAFVFLAGTSARLYGRRVERGALSRFLLLRGLWLVLLELTIVNFAWTFDVRFSLHIFQVIWAIGISLVCLAALVYLPTKIVIAIALTIIFGHNLLDTVTVAPGSRFIVPWSFLHQKTLHSLGQHRGIFVGYPMVP